MASEYGNNLGMSKLIRLPLRLYSSEFNNFTKFLFVVGLLSVLGTTCNDASTIITFPATFTSFEQEKIDPLEVKTRYQKGIEAVQNIAGLVNNVLLEESINFAAKNWVISPVSLAAVFAQLLMGSRGEIRKVLSTALSIDDGRDFTKLAVHRQLGNLMTYLEHPEDNDYVLSFNSVVFLQAGFPLKPTYKYALGDFYNTAIIPVDFTGEKSNSLRKINEWIKNSTNGRFSDLLSSFMPRNMVSIMANVVYFKGSWEIPFDPDYTQPGLFFIDQNRKVEVEYMFGEVEVLYGNTSDYQLIGLPFKSRDVVIYILLPNGRFSTKVALSQFDTMASTANLENVTLVLPKVKLQTTISVKDAISKYLTKPQHTQTGRKEKMNKNMTVVNELEPNENIPVPLTIPTRLIKLNGFDMSGASEDVRFRIDDILHKVSFAMDELGTEIVAATSTLVDHSNNNFILKVNRPFLFFIRHELTKTHLFWGLVSDPTQSTKPKKHHHR